MRVFVVILLAWAWFCALAWAQDRAAIDAGETLYEEYCLGCHGEKLRSPGTGFDLRKLTADQRALRQVRHGRQGPNAAVAGHAEPKRGRPALGLYPRQCG